MGTGGGVGVVGAIVGMVVTEANMERVVVGSMSVGAEGKSAKRNEQKTDILCSMSCDYI